MKYELHCGDCLEVLRPMFLDGPRVKVAFCDPPDNIDLGYGEYKDKMPDAEYVKLLANWLGHFCEMAEIVWFSFNARWTSEVGAICDHLKHQRGLDFKANVQVFTFGQHNKHDLGNNHRPLYRLMRPDAVIYPDAIRVSSWRQRNGDKRADPRGRVPGDVYDMQYHSWVKAAYDMLAEKPILLREGRSKRKSKAAVETPTDRIGFWLSAALDDPGVCPEMKHDIEAWFQTQAGDVFDFPRVTVNSKQRCDWHPTQLHEELVERCIKLSATATDRVVDPFGGTGTTLRVCRKLGIACTLSEFDLNYCKKIAELNGLKPIRGVAGAWGTDDELGSRNAA